MPAQPAQLTQPRLSPTGGTLQQRKYRELIRSHLGSLLDRLFAEFTGLHFHVSWAPAPPHEWQAQTLPIGCCCRLIGASSQPGACCRTCAPNHFDGLLHAEGNGYHFTCRRGARNFWFPIRVRGELLGVAYLQAFIHPIAKLPDARGAARAAQLRPSPLDGKCLTWSEFARAARLLNLIVQHVQTASLADLRKADLTNAGRTVLALEKEQARLHEALERHVPVARPVSRRVGPESHTEQAVQRLLECISQRYAQPVKLSDCATRLGMNAAYLSTLFSRHVGRPFKTYLTELRMEKAKELLNDPANNVSDVANAVS